MIFVRVTVNVFDWVVSLPKSEAPERSTDVLQEYGSTSELISDLAEQRPAARDAVARLMYGRVKRLARSLCGADADAEDVTQQVLLEVLRDAPGFRFEGSFERWVDRITIRRALRTARLERHRRGTLARWLLPDALPWGSDAKVSFEEPTSIDALLLRLSPERREAVILHHGLGYSVNEVAEMLDTPRGTVKDRLVASKRQLSKLLRGELEDRGWMSKRPSSVGRARETQAQPRA